MVGIATDALNHKRENSTIFFFDIVSSCLFFFCFVHIPCHLKGYTYKKKYTGCYSINIDIHRDTVTTYVLHVQISSLFFLSGFWFHSAFVLSVSVKLSFGILFFCRFFLWPFPKQ